MYNTTDTGYWWNNARWINIAPCDRPDYYTPESEKDEKYDRDCWRHYLGCQQSVYMDWFNATAAINTAFANELVWGMPEDKEMFLMDKGQTTTRRALKSPLIRPMVTRLVGQLSQVSIQARVTAETQRAKTRLEDQKKMAVLMARAAQAGGEMQRAVQTIAGLGPDEEQAQTKVEETYQDMLIPPVNSMLTMSSKDSDLESMRRQFGESLAVSGVCAAHAIIVGSKWIWKYLNPDELIFDVNANRSDLSDGEYVGCRPLQNVPSLCEQYQPSAAKIKALDSMTKQGGGNETSVRATWPNKAPRPHTIYWKDQKYVTRGFVQGPTGPMMVSIGEINPDTGKADWTMDDVIEPIKNRFTADWTGRTSRKCIQYIRYCTGIPYEYCPSGNGDMNEPAKIEDLILAHGVYPLQEADPDHIENVRFPIKFSTWSYMNGFIVAPVTAAVSPQRVQNQVLSDIVWRMSKASIGSYVIDKNSMVSGGMKEKQVLFNLKEGDPITVNAAHLGGAQNAVTRAEGNLSQDFFAMWELISKLREMAEASTGMYAENYGEPGSANKLVGVQQLQLQQSSIMQRPYYDAIQRLYEQMHQFTAQAGRQFYIRHPWVLENMVGTEGMDVLLASKDMELEQFRVGVKLALNSDQVKEGSDALIMQAYQLQLLDPESVGDLLGNSYPEDVYQRIRTFTKEKKQADMQMAQMQEKQAQAGILLQKDQMDAEQEAELYKQTLDASVKMEGLKQKADQPMVQAQADWAKPEAMQPQMAGA